MIVLNPIRVLDLDGPFALGPKLKVGLEEPPLVLAPLIDDEPLQLSMRALHRLG
jgi:hypothetical protein